MSWRVNSEDTIIEIIIRESSGAKIESYKTKLKDEKKIKSIFRLLRNKYGFGDFTKKDKDISWLNETPW